MPVLVLAAEVLASTLAVRGAESAGRGARPAVAIIVPAHNEEALLPATLASLAAQLDSEHGDRLLVVADNCNDATAAAARRAGAECLERRDDDRRGKGYALDAGVRHLASTGVVPPVVIFNDADVTVEPGGVAALARQCVETGRPAQGRYLMSLPPEPSHRDQVSRFALVLKNHVRPLGLWRLGLPCPLLGSGMAFSCDLARSMPLATGDLVEDMRLGLDLCGRGEHPLYCPAARFNGELPADDNDAATQRRRWEHGHMAVLLATPRLLGRGIVRGDVRLVAAALDHAVQPLTVLCGALSAIVVLTILRVVLLGGVGPIAATATAIAVGGLGLLALSLGVAWLVHLRREVPPSVLLGLPSYLLRRIPNQAAFVFRRQRAWVRTPRAVEREAATPSPGLPIDAPRS